MGGGGVVGYYSCTYLRCYLHEQMYCHLGDNDRAARVLSASTRGSRANDAVKTLVF